MELRIQYSFGWYNIFLLNQTCFNKEEEHYYTHLNVGPTIKVGIYLTP